MTIISKLDGFPAAGLCTSFLVLENESSSYQIREVPNHRPSVFTKVRTMDGWIGSGSENGLVRSEFLKIFEMGRIEFSMCTILLVML